MSSPLYTNRRRPTTASTPVAEAYQQEKQATTQVDVQAQTQDYMVDAAKNQEAFNKAQEQRAKDTAAQERANTAAAKRAGIKTTVDTEGVESIDRHPDTGKPVWESGFTSKPQATDKGAFEVPFRDPTGNVHRIPLDKISRTKDLTGTEIDEFDIPDANGQPQRIRRPVSASNPLFKVDLATGRRYTEAEDPTTGGMVQQPLGIDPAAASAAAINRRKEAYAVEKEKATFEGQATLAEQNVIEETLKPVKEKLTAAKQALKKLNTGPVWKQTPEGPRKFATANAEYGMPPTGPEEAAQADAYFRSKKQAEQSFAQVKGEHDPIKAQIDEMSMRRAKLAQKALLDGHRVQIEIDDMEKAAKAGVPVYEPDWRKRFDEVRRDPRFTRIATEAEHEATGSPLAADLAAATTQPELTTASKIFRDLQSASQDEHPLDGTGMFPVGTKPPEALRPPQPTMAEVLTNNLTASEPSKRVFPTNHPSVKNADGTGSNVVLAGFGLEGREYVLPTMVDGKQLTEEQAVALARKNGLDKYPSFATPAEATAWAEKNHGNIDARGYLKSSLGDPTAMAAKAFGIKDPENWTATPNEMGNFDLTKKGEAVGWIDPTTNAITLNKHIIVGDISNNQLSEVGQTLLRDAASDGMPVYVSGSKTRLTKVDLAGLVTQGLAARELPTEDAQREHMDAAGLSPAALKKRVLDGEISVQDARLFNEKFNDVQETSDQPDQVAARFAKWLPESGVPELFAKGTPDQRAAIANEFLNEDAAGAMNGIAFDREQYGRSRQALLANTDPRWAVTKAASSLGGMIKSGLGSSVAMMYGVAENLTYSIPNKLLGGQSDEFDTQWNNGKDFLQRQTKTANLVHRMFGEGELKGLMEEAKNFLRTSQIGEPIPADLDKRISEAAYDGYHRLTEENAKDLNTTREHFSLNNDRLLSSLVEHYQRTADPATLEEITSNLFRTQQERQISAATSKYVSDPRVVSPKIAAERAGELGLQIEPGTAQTLIGLASQLDKADTQDKARGLVAQAGKIIGTKSAPATLRALTHITHEESNDPDSWAAIWRGGKTADPGEMAVEVLSNAATAALAAATIGTGGTASPATLPAAAAVQAGKMAVKGAVKSTLKGSVKRVVNATFDAAWASTKTTAKLRPIIAENLIDTGKKFKALGIQTPKYGKPLTTGQKAANLLVGTAKVAGVAAPIEGIEGGVHALGENRPTLLNVAKAAGNEAVGSLGLIGIMSGGVAVKDAFAARGQAREYEQKMAALVKQFNATNAGVAGFKPITLADFEAAQGIMANPKHAASEGKLQATAKELLAAEAEDAAQGQQTPPAGTPAVKDVANQTDESATSTSATSPTPTNEPAPTTPTQAAEPGPTGQTPAPAGVQASVEPGPQQAPVPQDSGAVVEGEVAQPRKYSPEGLAALSDSDLLAASQELQKNRKAWRHAGKMGLDTAVGAAGALDNVEAELEKRNLPAQPASPPAFSPEPFLPANAANMSDAQVEIAEHYVLMKMDELRSKEGGMTGEERRDTRRALDAVRSAMRSRNIQSKLGRAVPIAEADKQLSNQRLNANDLAEQLGLPPLATPDNVATEDMPFSAPGVTTETTSTPSPAARAPSPRLLAARQAVEAAIQEHAEITTLSFAAMDELRNLPPAERPLYTAAAKISAGATDYTEAEAKAVIALNGSSAAQFQRLAPPLPAGVAGPRQLKSLTELPDVTPAGPNRYRLPEGVRITLPDTVLAGLMERAPSLGTLLQTPGSAQIAASTAKTTANDGTDGSQPEKKSTPVYNQASPEQKAALASISEPLKAKLARSNATAADFTEEEKQAINKALPGESPFNPETQTDQTDIPQDDQQATRKEVQSIVHAALAAYLKENPNLQKQTEFSFYVEHDGGMQTADPTGDPYAKINEHRLALNIWVNGKFEGSLTRKQVAAAAVETLHHEATHIADLTAAKRIHDKLTPEERAKEVAAYEATLTADEKKEFTDTGFTRWRTAHYSNIWNSFTDEQRGAMVKSYGTALLDRPDWIKGMEATRMAVQMRSTFGRISEAVILHIQEFLKAIKELVTNMSEPFAKHIAEVEKALAELLGEQKAETSGATPAVPAPQTIKISGGQSRVANFASAADAEAFNIWPQINEANSGKGTPEQRAAILVRGKALRDRLVIEAGKTKPQAAEIIAGYNKAVLEEAEKADPIDGFTPQTFERFAKFPPKEESTSNLRNIAKDKLKDPTGQDIISQLKELGRLAYDPATKSAEWEWYRQLQADAKNTVLTQKEVATRAAQGDVGDPAALLAWVNGNILSQEPGTGLTPDDAAMQLSSGELGQVNPVEATELGPRILEAIAQRRKAVGQPATLDDKLEAEGEALLAAQREEAEAESIRTGRTVEEIMAEPMRQPKARTAEPSAVAPTAEIEDDEPLSNLLDPNPKPAPQQGAGVDAWNALPKLKPGTHALPSGADLDSLPAFSMSGNKAALLRNYLLPFLTRLAKGATRFVDLFGGTGMYTHALAEAGVLPQGSILNEWEWHRALTHKWTQQDHQAVAAHMGEYLARMRETLNQHTSVDDKRTAWESLAIEFLNEQVNPNQALQQSEWDNYRRVPLKDEPKSAAMYLVVQGLAFGNRTLEVNREGVIEAGDMVSAPSLGRAIWTEGSGTDGRPKSASKGFIGGFITPEGYKIPLRVQSPLNYLRPASRRLQGVEIRGPWDVDTHGDALQILRQIVKDGDLVSYDPPYLPNIVTDESVNYGEGTGIFGSLEGAMRLFTEAVQPASDRGAMVVSTNNFQPALSARLSSLGWENVGAYRAGTTDLQDSELISFSHPILAPNAASMQQRGKHNWHTDASGDQGGSARDNQSSAERLAAGDQGQAAADVEGREGQAAAAGSATIRPAGESAERSGSFGGLASAPARTIVEPGFYSQLREAIAAKMPAKSNRATLKGIIANSNIKADELKWTGIVPWIDAQPEPITREQVFAHLEGEGKVTFKEVLLQNDIKEARRALNIYRSRAELEYGRDTEDWPEEVVGEAMELEMRVDEAENGGGSAPKYAQYQLPGGTNYKEVVLAMPTERSVEAEARAIAKNDGQDFDSLDPDIQARLKKVAQSRIEENRMKGAYSSSHFPDVPNYVAHMRTNERTDASGKEGLFIEEIQSDRHQAGREKGYKDPVSDAARTKAFDDMEAADRRRKAALARRDAGDESAQGDINQAMHDYEVALDASRATSVGFIPDAPYRTTWPLQMFKRALRDAIASGKDWVGWTTGETQADRYDLSKQVDKLVLYPDKNDPTSLHIVGTKDGRELPLGKHTRTSLPEVIGKEAAKKVDGWDGNPDYIVLEGLDLAVGGSGMKGFYDKILPTEIGKYVKQWGGKVEEGALVGDSDKAIMPEFAPITDDEWQGLSGAEEFKDGTRPWIARTSMMINGNKESVTAIVDASGIQFFDNDADKAWLISGDSLTKRWSKDGASAKESALERWNPEWGGWGNDRIMTQIGGDDATLRPATEAKKTPIWKVAITPEMTEGVQRGQALFSAPARLDVDARKQLADSWKVVTERDTVDGRDIINADNIPNTSSIRSSLDDYEILKGLREVPMNVFPGLTGRHYSVSGSNRIEQLASQIADSKEITPLIVVVDGEGSYILEGATRGEALFRLKAKSFPAMVVIDKESPPPAITRESAAQTGTVMPDGAVLSDGPGMVQMPLFSAPVRAYHGTPHKVDEFDLGKIGTGEGAQAFGWGLYFAQARKTAEGYRDKLSRGHTPIYNGKTPYDAQFLTEENLGTGDPDKIIAAALMNSVISSVQGRDGNAGALIKWARALNKNALSMDTEDRLTDIAWDIDYNLVTYQGKGNLYTVDLLPDEGDFIHWDDDVGEQPASAKEMLKPFIDKISKHHIEDTHDPDNEYYNPNGVSEERYKITDWRHDSTNNSAKSLKEAEAIAKQLTENVLGYPMEQVFMEAQRRENSPKEFSEYLLSLGIPGVRYLDGQHRDLQGQLYAAKRSVRSWQHEVDVMNSPGAKEQLQYAQTHLAEVERKWAQRTYNFVIFDDKLVKILEENGKPAERSGLLASAPARSDKEWIKEQQANGTISEPDTGLWNVANENGVPVGYVYDNGAQIAGMRNDGWIMLKYMPAFGQWDEQFKDATLGKERTLRKAIEKLRLLQSDAVPPIRLDDKFPAEFPLNRYFDYQGQKTSVSATGTLPNGTRMVQLQMFGDKNATAWVPLRQLTKGGESLFSAPAPAPARTAALEAALATMPQVWRDVLRSTWAGETVPAVAKKLTLPEIAVTNILRSATGRLNVLMAAQDGTLKPKVRSEQDNWYEEPRLKAVEGRPDLALGAEPDFVAVDRFREAPEVVTHDEMNDLADRMFAIDPKAAERMVVRWMDSGTIVVETEGLSPAMQAIMSEAKARKAEQMLMTAAAKKLSLSIRLRGGDSIQTARLIHAYRNTGTEQARALGMRRDPFKTPAERNAFYIAEAIYTPPESVRNEIRDNPENKDKLLAAWAVEADKLKEKLKAKGYDIDAAFAALNAKLEATRAADQEVIQAEFEAIPEQIAVPLSLIDPQTKTLVKAILEGQQTPRQAAALAGMTLAEAKAAFGAFRAKVNAAGVEAAEGIKTAMLGAAPVADYAAQIGIPFEDIFDEPDTIPIRTETTLKLRAAREKKAKAVDAAIRNDTVPFKGEFDLGNEKQAAQIVREIQTGKSTFPDKMLEFWRASILSGPQTQTVNFTSSFLYGFYETTFKKLGTGALADAARLFGMKPDAASLADVPAMAAAVMPALQNAFKDAIKSWQMQDKVFEHFAEASESQLGFGGVKAEEGFKPAIPGPVGTVMRSISFRLMLLADEFVKSFYGRIEVAQQARQIARSENLKGQAFADRITELMQPGSRAWIKSLDQSLKIGFQTKLGTGVATIDQLDHVANWLKSARRGPNWLKNASMFVLPFVDTPTNLFKQGMTLSPMGTFLALADASRALRHHAKGNHALARKIYNATRLFDDAINQTVAWGAVMAIAALIKPDGDDDKLLFITGTMPWRSTSRSERDNAYRTAPPQSIRIGGRWYSYARIDPFASALALTVDGIEEFFKGDSMAVVAPKVGRRMLDNMQDKTFLQGISDVMNAIENPERFGVRWATNIATGFVPNLIRQPIRSADENLRNTDIPKDVGFWDAVEKRMGYSMRPQSAPLAITTWGDPGVKNTGAGPNTDILLRLFSPVQTQRADNVDPLDVKILNWNNSHEKSISLAVPDSRIERTINGQKIVIDLTEADRTELARKVGKMTRLAIGSAYDNGSEPLTETDAKRIQDIHQKAKGLNEEIFVRRWMSVKH